MLFWWRDARLGEATPRSLTKTPTHRALSQWLGASSPQPALRSVAEIKPHRVVTDALKTSTFYSSGQIKHPIILLPALIRACEQESSRNRPKAAKACPPL